MDSIEREKIVNMLLKEHPVMEMFKFTDIDIQEKLQENSFNIVRYKELYYKELSVLEDLEIKYDALVGITYKFYRFDDDKEWQKKEIELYCIPSDKKIIQMKNIIEKQRTRVRFFEMVYKGFEQMGWRMKSFIDTMRSGY